MSVKLYMEEDTLLELLMDRVSFWTSSDDDVNELYEEYYKSLIDSGSFEGCELDVSFIVDNDYINYTQVLSSEDFEQYNIEDENDSRILIANKDKDLYLISIS